MWFRGRGKADRAIASYQRELVDTHYREVENMYRQMRMWRHDYRNHLQTMKALDTPIKSGNAMADVILSSKMSLAQAHGIDVRVDAHTHIPIKLRISELDLCCVLGNLFDNAIEASLRLPEEERMIRVYMDTKGAQLYISFTNLAAGGKQKKENGRFRSTKGAGHGFGLFRIDSVVGRLGGYIRRASEAGAFTTEILLPLDGAQFVPEN